MTVKEIAQAVGKEVRAVHYWIEKVSAKNAEVCAKVAQAKATSKPADYDLDETCKIIEEGMGTDVANTFKTNAVYASMRQESKPRLTGALVNALLKAERSGAISREQFQEMIGAPHDGPVSKPEPKALPAPDGLPDHIARQVYAVALNAINKASVQREANNKNESLF